MPMECTGNSNLHAKFDLFAFVVLSMFSNKGSNVIDMMPITSLLDSRSGSID